MKERWICLDASENGLRASSGKYIQIFLNGNVSNVEIEELKGRLSAERSLREGLTNLTFPVSIPEDRMIQIEWRSGYVHIKPGLSRLIDVFSKQGVRVEEDVRMKRNFANYASWSREELDDKIRQLLEKGEEFGAHSLVKMALKMNNAQTRAYIETLRRGRGSGETQKKID
jgi:intein-encoded DNA endonuclease-like protein